MGVFGKLFGKDTVVEAGISGIDKIFHTEEEKSDAKLAFLKAYEPFKLAQRMIAMTVIPPYVLAWLFTFVAKWYGHDIDGLLKLLQSDMGTMASIVIFFYFGGGAAEGIISRFKEKPKTKQ